MKKLLLLTICATLFFVSSGFAQECGGSINKIQISYDETENPPENADYQLFYVLPKNKTNLKNEEIIAFVSEFYYGTDKLNYGSFWKPYRNKKFLRVEKSKAEEYIGNYKIEDYENSVNSYWKENHEKQLKGISKGGMLVFSTLEMDDTPFLLKIEAEGFEPVYFLSSFLGGCVSRIFASPPIITLSSKNEKPRNKCPGANSQLIYGKKVTFNTDKSQITTDKSSVFINYICVNPC